MLGVPANLKWQDLDNKINKLTNWFALIFFFLVV